MYQWLEKAPGGSYVDVGSNSASFSFVTTSSTATGVWNFKLQVTDNAGAVATSSAASVTVNASPTVSVTPVGPLTLDAGQVQALTATASGGSGTMSYQWYVDGSAVGSNSASYSYTAAGTSHSVTCKVTDSASTPVTSPASNAVTITVDSALVAPTASASKSAVDQGQSSALTSTAVSSGTGPYIYQWLEMAPGGSYVDVGSNSASFSFVTSASTATGVWSFKLQVTDNAGAVVTSSAVTVTVSSASTATISLNPTSGSQGSSVLISGKNFAPNAQVHLSFGGQQITTVTAASDGSISNAQLTVPSGTSKGNYVVEASDGSQSAQATFTVTIPASITMTPTSGTVGTTIIISGSNFLPSTTLQISFAGQQVMTVKSASDGTFTGALYIVPDNTAAGDHTLQVSDGSNTAQKTFSVTAYPSAQNTATVNGNTATVDQTAQTGVNVTVSGSSLSSGEQITVTTNNYGQSPPAGLKDMLGAGATYFDVQVLPPSGESFGPDVYVTVSLTDPSFTHLMQISYWNGATWAVATNTQFDSSTHTITGTIPASALSGTPVAVGNRTNVALPDYPLAALIVLIALTACFAAFMVYKRQSNRPKA